jgi:hypothetical protein
MLNQNQKQKGMRNKLLLLFVLLSNALFAQQSLDNDSLTLEEWNANPITLNIQKKQVDFNVPTQDFSIQFQPQQVKALPLVQNSAILHNGISVAFGNLSQRHFNFVFHKNLNKQFVNVLADYNSAFETNYKKHTAATVYANYGKIGKKYQTVFNGEISNLNQYNYGFSDLESQIDSASDDDRRRGWSLKKLGITISPNSTVEEKKQIKTEAALYNLIHHSGYNETGAEANLNYNFFSKNSALLSLGAQAQYASGNVQNIDYTVSYLMPSLQYKTELNGIALQAKAAYLMKENPKFLPSIEASKKISNTTLIKAGYLSAITNASAQNTAQLHPLATVNSNTIYRIGRHSDVYLDLFTNLSKALDVQVRAGFWQGDVIDALAFLDTNNRNRVKTFMTYAEGMYLQGSILYHFGSNSSFGSNVKFWRKNNYLFVQQAPFTWQSHLNLGIGKSSNLQVHLDQRAGLKKNDVSNSTLPAIADLGAIFNVNITKKLKVNLAGNNLLNAQNQFYHRFTAYERNFQVGARYSF